MHAADPQTVPGDCQGNGLRQPADGAGLVCVRVDARDRAGERACDEDGVAGGEDPIGTPPERDDVPYAVRSRVDLDEGIRNDRGCPALPQGCEEARDRAGNEDGGRPGEDRHPSPGTSGQRGNPGRRDRGVLPEDRLLELAELGARLDPEVVDEDRACRPIRLECIRLSPRAIERQHQLGTKALPEGMLRNEVFELGDQLPVAAALELAVDPRLDAAQTQLFQALDLVPGEIGVCELGQRRAAPEGEGRRSGRFSPGARSGSRPARQLVRRDPEQVPGVARLDASGSEGLAQGGDMPLQRLPDRLRRLLPPQRVDQAVVRDDLVCVEKQDDEECAAPAGGKLDRTAFVVDHFQGPENAEIQSCLPAPTLPALPRRYHAVTGRDRRVGAARDTRIVMSRKGVSMNRTTLIAAATVALVALAAAVPALAVPPAPIKVAGTQTTVDFAHGKFAMRGSLVGAWQVTGGSNKYLSTSAQLATGTVAFTGCLDSNRNKACEAGEPTGTLRLSYTFEAAFNPANKAFLRGSSIETVLGGTGSFANAKGVMVFDHGATGVSSYRGELRLA